MRPVEAGRLSVLRGSWARGIAAALAAMVLASSCGAGDDTSSEQPSVDTDNLERGQALYETSCAACHGTDLRGTDKGPSFLDVTYAPNHHSDEAFLSAVANGVQPHHWNFGPMPPQEGLSDDDVVAIVAYVRSAQEREGVTFDPSHG
ncbi:MAG: cytochrome c [Acidimicrobiia bacterium]|nr:cytochrome c [Acidimicrobiia bacterium]